MGTDAEFFVQDKSGNIGSAIGMIGGSKAKPMIVPFGNLQEDNVLAEFAIDPVSTKAAWMYNITYVIRTLRRHMMRQRHTLVLRSSFNYDKELLKSFDPMAMEMGCMPDYDVYAQRDNEKPNPCTTLRTAAAHVHFSYENNTEAETCKIVKAMDYALGLWSVIEDADTARRAMYGKAGSCRIKIYGGEYRTLGSFWLHTDDMKGYVYDITSVCVKSPDEVLRSCQLVLGEQELCRIINECDKKAALLYYPMISSVLSEQQAIINNDLAECRNVKLSA